MFIYEGVRNTSLSNASVTDISKLISADIVLTTYDVLKEDLSHDSDRHEGDRRFMRFQKRFLQSICFIFRRILIFDFIYYCSYHKICTESILPRSHGKLWASSPNLMFIYLL